MSPSTHFPTKSDGGGQKNVKNPLTKDTKYGIIISEMRDARADPKTQVVAIRRNPTKTSPRMVCRCASNKCEPVPFR
jgi:hypothetical protein